MSKMFSWNQQQQPIPIKGQQQEFTVHPQKLLRKMPGRRVVFSALHGSHRVIVKVFLHPQKANRHLKREQQGLQILHERGILTPKIYATGTAQGYPILITEEIFPAHNALELWQQQFHLEKGSVLLAVLESLAQLHQKGVVQKDLHLDNFLLKDSHIYLIDAAQVVFVPGPLGKKESLAQLALLASQLPLTLSQQRQFFDHYLTLRKLPWGEQCWQKFLKLSDEHRQNRIAKTLKKYLRSNSRHTVTNTPGYYGVVERSLPHAQELPEKIENWLQQGTVLKNGNTCFVAKVTINEKTFVIKRYNHKGWWHSLRQSLKTSRARRCFISGHRLLLLGIATPQPLGFLEKHRAGTIETSYLLCEYVEAPCLGDYLAQETSLAKRQAVAEQTQQVIARLHQAKISHGDLKHQNILVTTQGPSLIDLDGMHQHLFTRPYQKRKNKDLARFAKNWRDNPAWQKLFEKK